MAGKRLKTLTKRHYDLARRLASNGLSRGMIAQALGMSEATIYRRIEADERLREALTLGDGEDVQLCVNTLREKALAGSAQHMDRYLQLRHGIYVGGARPQGFERQSGPTIVVLPFETGQVKWDNEQANDKHMMIEGEVIQNTIQNEEQ